MSNASTFSKDSRTDWQRLERQCDEDIDLGDIPEVTPEMFARAVARRGLKPVPRKQQVTLRIDEDVLAWFRSQGPGYQTRINSLLRVFVEEQRRQR
jgi:uncharacterized protein (DUF4415 family)